MIAVIQLTTPAPGCLTNLVSVLYTRVGHAPGTCLLPWPLVRGSLLTVLVLRLNGQPRPIRGQYLGPMVSCYQSEGIVQYWPIRGPYTGCEDRLRLYPSRRYPGCVISHDQSESSI